MDIFAHVFWTNLVFHPHTKKFIKKIFRIQDAPAKSQNLDQRAAFGEGASKKSTAERTQRFMAVLFGVAPDLVSFVPVFMFLLFTRAHFDFYQALNSQAWVYRWGRESYNFTHSIVIFLATMLIVAAIKKGKIYWPMFGWGLHIVIDIFTHKNFFATPFLFPLSGYHFTHGLSWAHPTFMLINYSLLAIVYLFWFLILRKKHTT